MLRFSIYSPDSMVVVDNASAVVSLAALPTNVVVVAYQVDQGSVEYNDRPRLRIPFTDPAPYQPFLNLWITAAQAPALQLAQAKQLKIDLVEAIFHHKRRLPYAYGAWSYDAHDESVTNVDLQVQATATVSTDVSGLIASINAAFTAITNQVNATVVGGANAMVNANNVSAAAVNDWSYYNAVNWPKISTQFGSLTGGVGGNHDYAYLTSALAAVGSGGFGNMAAVVNITGATVSGALSPGFSHVGNITLQPLNAAAPQSIPATDVYTALLGIANRRNSLNTNRLTKQIAINALSTIAAVAAYDATTGWSF